MDTKDHKALYLEQLAPLLQQAQELCDQAGIAMFAAVSFDVPGEDGEWYTYTTATPDKIMPPQMRFAHKILVANPDEDTPAARLLSKVVELGMPTSVQMVTIDPEKIDAERVAAALAKRFEQDAEKVCSCRACVAKREGRVHDEPDAMH